jgi:DNA-binding NtrC family response regulator
MDKINAKILIVDDDKDVLTTARIVLKQKFSDVVVELNPKMIPSYLKNDDFEIVVLDMNFRRGATEGREGLFWLQKIRETHPEVCVIMNTAYGDIQLAVEAMKLGASEFIVKPWESEKLIATVESVVKFCQSKKQIKKLKSTQTILNDDLNKNYPELKSRARNMLSVISTIEKVSVTDANILVLGENGTGKELVAREIYRKSNRKDKVFIGVDLGSISENLFETELFGHVKGAFTDAKEDKPGRFEIASDGTLFLDEIGNLSLNLQAKLLSVIQNKKITPVGSNKNIDIDIRLICATNKDLYDMVEKGEFRQDLLYRINTVEISIPPLRKRTDDILFLAEQFLFKFSAKYNKKGLKISQKSKELLLDYNWPGNIRELQHIMERAVIMAENKYIHENDFSLKVKEKVILHDTLNVDLLEKQAIINAIDKNKGNFTKASEDLGMGRSTLYRKMKKYGI